MAQGIRQPIHSITSLAVPIETDGNASAAGTQKRGGGQSGEERGLAKKDRGETDRVRRGKHVSSTLTLSVQTPVNGLLSHFGERSPYRTMETQRNGQAMLQTAPWGWQRLHWRRRPAPVWRETVPRWKQKLFSPFLSVCCANLLTGVSGWVGAIWRFVSTHCSTKRATESCFKMRSWNLFQKESKNVCVWGGKSYFTTLCNISKPDGSREG